MASGKRDYYEVLGVQRSSSEKEIAQAYRKLAIKFHPDSHPGDEEATARFKEAAEAYEVLSDPEKRSRYDRFGHAGAHGAGDPGFRDVGDIFDAFGDIFGFGDVFGGGRRKRQPRRGADIQGEVLLDLEEAVAGVHKEIKFQRSKLCDRCNGSGAASGSNPVKCSQCGGRGAVVQSAGILRVQTTCPSCQGAGQTIKDPCHGCLGRGIESEEVSIEVDIPAGVDEGMQVRLTGQGEPSPRGGPPGDFYCAIRVREHPLFTRNGQDLHLRIPISYTQATLGAKLDVPTLDGAKELKIPSGTESGSVFEIPNTGAPSPHGRGRGSLLVETFVEVPKKLNKHEEELLRQLADIEHSNVAPQRQSFLDKLKAYFSADSTQT